MIRRVVEIVPLDVADGDLLLALAGAVSRVFPFECRVGAAGMLPTEALDEARGQYLATRILEHLDASERSAFRLLGVTGADLYTPILRFMFGEAMLGGRAALVSIHRLGPSSPGQAGAVDRPVFVNRVLKEGIHELGHTFNLTHCNDPSCVMSASLDTSRIDAKSATMCPYCRIMFEDAIIP